MAITAILETLLFWKYLLIIGFSNVQRMFRTTAHLKAARERERELEKLK